MSERVSEIIVAGWVDLDPAQRDAALAAAAPLLAPTRAQPGCVHYHWGADPERPGRAYVYERWASQAALAAHLAGPCYAKMLAVLGAHGVRRLDVLKHRTECAEPVYDPSGRPRADFFTSGA